MKLFSSFRNLAFMLTPILAGCGAGLQAQSEEAPVAAKFAGAYQMQESGTQCMTKDFLFPSQNFKRYGADQVLVEKAGMAYRICGDEVWVGPIAAKIDGVESGNGTANMAIYANGSFKTGGTGQLSGIILTSGGRVTYFDMRDPQGSSAAVLTTRLSARNYASTNDIAGDYSTLAGSYVSPRPNTGLDISNSGVLTGSSTVGKVSGQVTAFDQETHVHRISLTVTPASGSPVTMTGVLGPFNDGKVDSNMPLGENSKSIMIAVQGGGIAYADVLSHK